MLEEVKGLGKGAVLPDELDTIFTGTGRGHDFVYHPDPFKGEVAVGHEGFPDVVAGKFLFF